MLFNSLQFCAFFLAVTCLYYLLPRSNQWKLLLVASCCFYMSFIPLYILVLFVLILIDYSMALLIDSAEGEKRRLYLGLSIASTCLVLFTFKYFNFFATASARIGHLFGIPFALPLLTLALPIGLSFHTFQSLSYVFEVYRRNQKPERHLGIYSLYVMFYPQLVAGPIERPQHLLHQFYEEHHFDQDNVQSGLSVMAWGFFQKMVIADRAAIYVNRVYGNWANCSGLELLIATVLFAVQIYADFAGYSNIAIGAARVMGFKLMTNFNHPYFSTSIGEFWRRWHISLSTWFKDYLYIPLGGSHGTVTRTYINLLITFTISGLWHGANWTFVIWGAYNGLLLLLEKLAARWYMRTGLIWTACRRCITLVLIMVGWVFFRSQSVSQALGIIQRVTTELSLSLNSIENAVLIAADGSSSLNVLSATILLILIMFLLEAQQEFMGQTMPVHLIASRKWSALSVVVLFPVIMLFGVFKSSAFIYFQF